MFLNVALTKINELIKRADFKDIGYLDDKNVTILFENKSCNVNESGRVTWGEHEETETTRLKDSNTKLNKPTVSSPTSTALLCCPDCKGKGYKRVGPDQDGRFYRADCDCKSNEAFNEKPTVNNSVKAVVSSELEDEVVKVRYQISTDNVGSECSDIVEIEKEYWDSLSDDGKEAEMKEEK